MDYAAFLEDLVHGIPIAYENLNLRLVLGSYKGVEHDPQIHSEGDLREHTLLTLMVMREICDLLRESTTVDSIVETEIEIRMLSALFHDIGVTETVFPRYFGHAAVGAKITKDLLGDMDCPREIVERVVRLIRCHHVLDTSRDVDRLVEEMSAILGPDVNLLIDLIYADHVGRGVDCNDLPANYNSFVKLHEKEVVHA